MAEIMSEVVESIFVAGIEPQIYDFCRYQSYDHYLAIGNTSRVPVVDFEGFRTPFFCFAFACLPYSIRRAVDTLARVESTSEYEYSPLVAT